MATDRKLGDDSGRWMNSLSGLFVVGSMLESSAVRVDSGLAAEVTSSLVVNETLVVVNEESKS